MKIINFVIAEGISKFRFSFTDSALYKAGNAEPCTKGLGNAGGRLPQGKLSIKKTFALFFFFFLFLLIIQKRHLLENVSCLLNIEQFSPALLEGTFLFYLLVFAFHHLSSLTTLSLGHLKR